MPVTSVLLRVVNGLVSLFGLTLIAFAGYIFYLTQGHSVNTVPSIVLALGVINFAFGLFILTCGFKSLFALRLYGLVLGLFVIELVQIALAICFQVPSLRDQIVKNLTGVPQSIMDQLNANTAIAGYILISAAACLLVSLVLVFLQACSLDQGFDETKFDEESLLGSRKTDRFGALSDEFGASGGTPSAKERYREKHGSYYSKYGLGK